MRKLFIIDHRVTIDTLEDLLRSHIPPSTGATENRQFFLEANDEVARKVGEKMEVFGYSDDLVRLKYSNYS